MRKGLRGNACAGILDLQHDPPMFLVRSSQFDIAARWGKLQGVFDDVEKDPAQLISIAAQRGQTWGHLVREALAMDLALHLHAYVSQKWGNFNGCEVQHEAAFVQAREGQQVRDQALHALDFGVHPTHQTMGGLLITTTTSAQNYFHTTTKTSQRPAQFLSHIRN